MSTNVITGDVEAVAPLHEAGGLLRGVDVEAAGVVHRLVGDHAHGAPVETAEPGDEAGRVRGPQLEERVVIEHVVDDDPHVVGRRRTRRHRGRGARAVAVGGIVVRTRAAGPRGGSTGRYDSSEATATIASSSSRTTIVATPLSRSCTAASAEAVAVDRRRR